MENQLLKGKVAIVFGASGNLGRQTAKVFVENGANVHVSDIDTVGLKGLEGFKSIETVDALDEVGIDAYMQKIVDIEGKIDIVVNLSGSDPRDYNHGKPAMEVSLDQFLIPMKTATATQFITAKSAYRHMSKQKAGVILFITSTLSKVGSPWSPALSASHAATEGLVKCLASEWSADGVRIIGVMSEAMPESPVIDYTYTEMGKNLGLSKDEMQGFIEQNKTVMKRLPSATETAGIFALAASDLASYMTGTILNHSGGHVLQ